MSSTSDSVDNGSDIEEAQLQEVRRRIKDVRDARVQMIPGEQAFREIEQCLLARRSDI